MINMIVAVAKNGVIGKNGILPWRISEDLKAFKELTMGGTLYVGKKTAGTLPPLNGRNIVVLNRNSYPTLMDIGNSTKQEWILGGGEIYKAALSADIVDRVYLTVIDKEYDGDTYFSIEQFKNPKWLLVNEKILRANDPFVKMQEWIKNR